MPIPLRSYCCWLLAVGNCVAALILLSTFPTPYRTKMVPVGFCDPYAPRQTHYSPSETAALLDLLVVDNLIDSKSPLSEEQHCLHLLNDLLAVDLAFRYADDRNHKNLITAPKLRDQKDVFLDLLSVDQEVDYARGHYSSSSHSTLEQHFATTTALRDPYAPRAHSIIHPFAGVYAADIGRSSEEQLLRDNVILMYLLAVDESMDNTKRWNKFVGSDSHAIFEDLYYVDREVSGAQTREMLIDDLQDLLDVDHLVDGVRR
jgi:hypothetical protein